MRYFFLVILLFSTTLLSAQNSPKYWQPSVLTQSHSPFSSEATFQILQLHFDALQNIIQQKSGFITLPLPDGHFYTLQIEETHVMSAALTARYPYIRSFRGVNKMARLDITSSSFHAIFEYQGRTIYIDPLKDQPNHYISYYEDEVNEMGKYDCATVANNEIIERNKDIIQTRSAGVDLKIYRMAIACTGEFTQRFGGTVESALATIVSTVNRMNYIFGRELGVNFQLITHNDEFIFTDPETDPFPRTEQVGDILSKSISLFRDSFHLSNEDYDIGHIFVVNCDGANGVAYPGGMCGNSRAGGVTCFTSSNLDAVVTSIFAHEVAHQFGATHTFSVSCHPLQVIQGADVEPFCGHSIMSYNTTDKISYFHAISLEQMSKFIQSRSQGGCGITAPTTNQNIPALKIKYRTSFTIPKQTPFELTAIASDADGDTLTYSWEQCDAGSSLYPSNNPSNNPTRIFPSLPFLLTGISDSLNKLPEAARDLTFRCTVRDNHAPAGAIAWEEVDIKVGFNGPFKITYPNHDSIIWQVGNEVEVRWDVAGTAGMSQLVNIKLSINGGNTFPILLAREVPNNGLAIINLPDAATEQARIRVEAVDNIFFNISNYNFIIQSATEPSFIIDAYPKLLGSYCISQPLHFQINIEPIKDFEELLTLSIEGNLPEGTTYEFSKNPVYPLEQTNLTLFFNKSQEEFVNLQVKATSADGTSKKVDVPFFLLPQDINTIQLVRPAAEHLQSNEYVFKWTSDYYAYRYDLEIATSPIFDSTIVYRVENIPQTTWRQPIYLEMNQLFYWRIRPVYECGVGKWTTPEVFTYISLCHFYDIVDNVRLNNFVVDYPIQVTDTGTVSKVELSAMQLYIRNHTNGYLEVTPKISIISPSGRQIYLADAHCNIPFDNVYWVFNDLETYQFSCSQVGAQGYQLFARPADSFSHFIGDHLAGEWKLHVEYRRPLDSISAGIFNTNLILCKDPPLSPSVIRLDTLTLSVLETQTITSGELNIQDLYNNPSNIIYTLVSIPLHGKLKLKNRALKVGDVFNQQDISDKYIQYVSESNLEALDSFHFSVKNHVNGILPVQPFYIKIQNITSGTTVEKSHLVEVNIFPNPAKNNINIQFNNVPKDILNINLYNIQGQEIQRYRFDKPMKELQINTDQLPEGIYFLMLLTGESVVTKKVIIQR